MPKLFIRLLSPAVAGDDGYQVDAAWMIQEDNGQVRAHGETDFRGLSELIDPGAEWLQSPSNIIVTVPSEHVLSLSCEVPGRSIGQIRRALPFVVEEFVTTDIESMQIATGELRRGAPCAVDVVDRGLLDDWLACLAALDIRPGYLFPDAELLPAEPGQASLLLDDERVLIRTGDQAAAVDRPNLALAIGALAVQKVCVVHGTLTDLEIGELSQSGELVLSDEGGATATVLDYVAAHWRARTPINLLQGAYKPKQPDNPNWQRWRPVAALVAVWVGVALVAMIAEALYAGYKADTLQTATTDLYRKIFPGETRVINARRQLEAKLGERSGGPAVGFVDFLGPLASSLAPTARIQSLNFSGDRNELAVDLLVGGFEVLDGPDGIKQQLGEQGVGVEITSAEQTDQGVRARLRLRGEGA